MTRAVTFVASLLCASTLLSTGCRDAQVDRPRHLVLVLVDTLRRDFLGVYGFEGPTTPFLDSLAEQGVVYDAASTQASHTFVSTASIFTSRYFPWFVKHEAYRAPESFTPQQRLHFSRYEYLADANVTLAETLADAGYRTLALFTNPHHHPTSGFWQGFEHAEYLPQPTDHQAHASAETVRERFLGLLDSDDDGRPLFAYLHFMEPHTPYLPPPELAELFVAAGRGNPALRATGVVPKGYRLTAEDIELLRELYAAEVRAVDDVLRRIVGDLQERGLWDETLLVVASDHGEEFMERGRLGHAQGLDREQLRAPLLFLGRTGVAPRRIATPVRNLDLAPTLLAMLGVSPSEDFRGELLPGLGLEATAGPRRSHAWWQRWRSLSDDRWHLIVETDRGTARLYDLEADPAGLRNVVDQHPEVVERMRASLERLEKQHVARDAESDAFEDSAAPPTEEIRTQLRALGYAE
jgi:arylsulfatase A-like enzyme